MAADEIVGYHSFCFNPNDNGGEGLTLTTTFIDNGDPAIYTNQELTLHSYFNSATISLTGSPITPDNLRRLADELELAQAAAIKKVQGHEL